MEAITNPKTVKDAIQGIVTANHELGHAFVAILPSGVRNIFLGALGEYNNGLSKNISFDQAEEIAVEYLAREYALKQGLDQMEANQQAKSLWARFKEFLSKIIQEVKYLVQNRRFNTTGVNRNDYGVVKEFTRLRDEFVKNKNIDVQKLQPYLKEFIQWVESPVKFEPAGEGGKKLRLDDKVKISSKVGQDNIEYSINNGDGYASITLDDDTANIDSILVNTQGQGIGTSSLIKIAKDLKKRGVKYLTGSFVSKQSLKSVVKALGMPEEFFLPTTTTKDFNRALNILPNQSVVRDGEIIAGESDGVFVRYDLADIQTQPKFRTLDQDTPTQSWQSIQLEKDQEGNILAPNGSKSLLAEKLQNDLNLSGKDLEAVIQKTRTPEFKQWFGDSNVVDKNFEPLPAYHGSNIDFNEFDTNSFGKTDAGFLGFGFYFYAGTSESYRDSSGYGKVSPYFLKMNEPYYITGEEQGNLIEQDSIDYSKEFTDNLIDEGYDGVYFNEDLRGEHVVFSPNQIKSIFNEGQFSSGTNDIRFRSVPVYQGTGADFNKFSTDFVGKGEGVSKFGWGLYFTDKKDIAKYYAERSSAKQGERKIYETKINDDNLLNWDLNIDESINDKIIKTLEEQGFESDSQQLRDDFDSYGETMNGDSIYSFLSEALGSEKKASEFLSKIGIGGVVADTVIDNKDTKVYVMFKADNLDIINQTKFRNQNNYQSSPNTLENSLPQLKSILDKSLKNISAKGIDLVIKGKIRVNPVYKFKVWQPEIPFSVEEGDRIESEDGNRQAERKNSIVNKMLWDADKAREISSKKIKDIMMAELETFNIDNEINNVSKVTVEYEKIFGVEKAEAFLEQITGLQDNFNQYKGLIASLDISSEVYGDFSKYIKLAKRGNGKLVRADLDDLVDLSKRSGIRDEIGFEDGVNYTNEEINDKVREIDINRVTKRTKSQEILAKTLRTILTYKYINIFNDERFGRIRRLWDRFASKVELDENGIDKTSNTGLLEGYFGEGIFEEIQTIKENTNLKAVVEETPVADTNVKENISGEPNQNTEAIFISEEEQNSFDEIIPQFGNTKLNFSYEVDKALYLYGESENTAITKIIKNAIEFDNDSEIGDLSNRLKKKVNSILEQYKDVSEVSITDVIFEGEANAMREEYNTTMAGEKDTTQRIDYTRKLPDNLTKGKPRYGYGTRIFLPDFESDVDKALFITSKTKRLEESKRDGEYRQFLVESGFTQDEINEKGKEIRERIKNIVKDEEGGTPQEPQEIFIPSTVPLTKPKINVKPIQTLPKVEIPTIPETPSDTTNKEIDLTIEGYEDVLNKIQTEIPSNPIAKVLKSFSVVPEFITAIAKSREDVLYNQKIGDSNLGVKDLEATIGASAKLNFAKDLWDKSMKGFNKAYPKFNPLKRNKALRNAWDLVQMIGERLDNGDFPPIGFTYDKNTKRVRELFERVVKAVNDKSPFQKVAFKQSIEDGNTVEKVWSDTPVGTVIAIYYKKEGETIEQAVMKPKVVKALDSKRFKEAVANQVVSSIEDIEKQITETENYKTVNQISISGIKTELTAYVVEQPLDYKVKRNGKEVSIREHVIGNFDNYTEAEVKLARDYRDLTTEMGIFKKKEGLSSVEGNSYVNYVLKSTTPEMEKTKRNDPKVQTETDRKAMTAQDLVNTGTVDENLENSMNDNIAKTIRSLSEKNFFNELKKTNNLVLQSKKAGIPSTVDLEMEKLYEIENKLKDRNISATQREIYQKTADEIISLYGRPTQNTTDIANSYYNSTILIDDEVYRINGAFQMDLYLAGKIDVAPEPATTKKYKVGGHALLTWVNSFGNTVNQFVNSNVYTQLAANVSRQFASSVLNTSKLTIQNTFQIGMEIPLKITTGLISDAIKGKILTSEHWGNSFIVLKNMPTTVVGNSYSEYKNFLNALDASLGQEDFIKGYNDTKLEVIAEGGNKVEKAFEKANRFLTSQEYKKTANGFLWLMQLFASKIGRTIALMDTMPKVLEMAKAKGLNLEEFDGTKPEYRTFLAEAMVYSQQNNPSSVGGGTRSIAYSAWAKANPFTIMFRSWQFTGLNVFNKLVRGSFSPNSTKEQRIDNLVGLVLFMSLFIAMLMRYSDQEDELTNKDNPRNKGQKNTRAMFPVVFKDGEVSINVGDLQQVVPAQMSVFTMAKGIFDAGDAIFTGDTEKRNSYIETVKRDWFGIFLDDNGSFKSSQALAGDYTGGLIPYKAEINKWAGIFQPNEKAINKDNEFIQSIFGQNTSAVLNSWGVPVGKVPDRKYTIVDEATGKLTEVSKPRSFESRMMDILSPLNNENINLRYLNNGIREAEGQLANDKNNLGKQLANGKITKEKYDSEMAKLNQKQDQYNLDNVMATNGSGGVKGIKGGGSSFSSSSGKAKTKFSVKLNPPAKATSTKSNTSKTPALKLTDKSGFTTDAELNKMANLKAVRTNGGLSRLSGVGSPISVKAPTVSLKRPQAISIKKPTATVNPKVVKLKPIKSVLVLNKKKQ